MAHMIPPVPRDIDEKSDEGLVFNCLKKLPDDYYVFHSVKATGVENDKLYEREIDFVVANQKKGILCIEAKNGANISYNGRNWYYSSGKLMEHEGPYNQIASAKRTIISKIKGHPNEDVQELSSKCKVMHAVFFFRMSTEKFMQIAHNGLPENADVRFTMLAEDLINPTAKIADIFSLKLPVQSKNTVEENKMTEEEFQLLLDSVLCPAFNLIPSPKSKNIIMIDQMNQLLREQYRLLDFLEEQQTAVINGAAGTGKTMLATYKAMNHSIDGEKVLFLCYNHLLCDHLITANKNNDSKAHRAKFKNVDFMTISKLAKEVTGNYKDYDGLMNWLVDCIGNPDKFGYKHVIVDEGQDFGLFDEKIGVTREQAKKNCSLVDALQEVAVENGGTFFLFYDKYQMIQGGSSSEYELPDCIQNSDCKLTLHCNCRNTKEIARTSVTPLKDQKNRAIKPTVACSWYEPAKPIMHIVSDDSVEESLHKILDKYREEELEDIIILTNQRIDYCAIADKLIAEHETGDGYCHYQYDGKNYKVTTCIKFKGLEADAIIMLDLSRDSFKGKKGLEFYVGTSRAKIRLDFICNISEEEYFDVVHELDENAPKRNDPDRMRTVLGNTFGADVVLE